MPSRSCSCARVAAPRRLMAPPMATCRICAKTHRRNAHIGINHAERQRVAMRSFASLLMAGKAVSPLHRAGRLTRDDRGCKLAGASSMREYPLIPLKQTVVFPRVPTTLTLARPHQLRAAASAWEGTRTVILVKQRE